MRPSFQTPESWGISEKESTWLKAPEFGNTAFFLRDTADDAWDTASEKESISLEAPEFGNTASFLEETADDNGDMEDTFNAGEELVTGDKALRQMTLSYAQYDLESFQGLETIKKMLKVEGQGLNEIEDFIEKLQERLAQNTDEAFVKIRQILPEGKADFEALFEHLSDSVQALS